MTTPELDAATTDPAPAAPARSWLPALAADVVAVLAFVVLGRTSHDEGSYLAGTAATAWPFLVALGLGWLAVRGWRRPRAVWPTAVLVLAVTVVGAMALRVLVGDGAPLPFVVVTTVVLAVFLLGWRAVAGAVVRRRSAGAA